jgi:predicted nucleic acid-binding protein
MQQRLLKRKRAMRDYLIDTNIWEYWFNPSKEPSHGNVLKLIDKIKQEESRLWISVITWGEIEYGYCSMKEKERSLETEFRQFVNDRSPKVYDIDKHVAATYGQIRTMLFEKYAPEEKKRKGKRPEQLVDPVTAKELGIQENDLWIIAQAVTKDMVLVTNDKKLIRPIVEILGSKLITENWAEQKIEDRRLEMGA